ncbi:ImmA/IrrE family metallo-endopeptidase [Lacticaseibacillus saniviri]|nr:ImmA/IrrE family metallo-endopeptidase [Lacticaseibacillus saniviri]
MSYDSDRAIEMARYVIRRYNTRDPWELVGKLPNVAVNTVDLGANIQGYSLISRRMSIINLNENMNEQETNDVLAHEIGHSLLTRDTSTNYFYKNASKAHIGSSEYVANSFMFQFIFGDRGDINPFNRLKIIEDHGLPTWMTEYFDIIN